MVHQYAPAINVSPFIRFSRWALLISGIAYGALWNARHSSYEGRMRPIWDQEKADRDAHLKAEKDRMTAETMRDLENMAK